MQKKGLAFEQLFDVRAVRILVDDVPACYGALGVVHSLFAYLSGEFDDYIATPKPNGYRSIHTAVLGPGDKTLEVQIRTHEMHQTSEHGVASHWRYKEGSVREAGYDVKLNALRDLLAPRSPGEGDFLDQLGSQLFAERFLSRAAHTRSSGSTTTWFVFRFSFELMMQETEPYLAPSSKTVSPGSIYFLASSCSFFSRFFVSTILPNWSRISIYRVPLFLCLGRKCSAV
jgi:hypothetical protein